METLLHIKLLYQDRVLNTYCLGKSARRLLISSSGSHDAGCSISIYMKPSSLKDEMDTTTKTPLSVDINSPWTESNDVTSWWEALHLVMFEIENALSETSFQTAGPAWNIKFHENIYSEGPASPLGGGGGGKNDTKKKNVFFPS